MLLSLPVFRIQSWGRKWPTHTLGSWILSEVVMPRPCNHSVRYSSLGLNRTLLFCNKWSSRTLLLWHQSWLQQQYCKNLRKSNFQKNRSIRVDYEFYMIKAYNYRRKMHKDSPSRWFSFTCLYPSGTEEFHGYLKITTNLEDAEILIGQRNQTFQIKEIISIYLRLNIFLLQWIEVNNIDWSLFQNHWKTSFCSHTPGASTS